MSFFRRKRLFIILIGFILLVGLIGFSLKEREELTTVEQFLHDSVGWVQNVISVPVQYVTSVVSNMEEVKNVYEENKVLKSQLSQYKNVLYEVQELRQDNEELRSILTKTESIRDFQPIQASVIARSPEQWFKQIKINKGKQHGVRQNMAVITGDGMVGKVQAASQFTSTVLLLNGFDRSNRISANIDSETNEQHVTGFITGYDQDKEALLLELTEDEVEVKEGEPVFTSAMGGVFPEGLEIGTIKEVTLDEYGLAQLAYVETSANLMETNHVIVVNRLAVNPEDDTTTEEEEE